jgi:hypothetical protein
MVIEHMGETQKLAQKFKIVETYWHGHSLESSWGALSDGTISFSIKLFWGKMHFLNFTQKTSVLKELRICLSFGAREYFIKWVENTIFYLTSS